MTIRRVLDATVQSEALAHSVVQHVLRAIGSGTSGVSERRLVGRSIAQEAAIASVAGCIQVFESWGWGRLELAMAENERFVFHGRDLVEWGSHEVHPHCDITLGIIEGVVEQLRRKPALGTEVACHSKGAPDCTFVIQAKRA